MIKTLQHTGHNGALPDVDAWKFSGTNAQYVFFCDNETVHGVEFNPFPFEVVPSGVPVVCDMSSSILSRRRYRGFIQGLNETCDLFCPPLFH